MDPIKLRGFHRMPNVAVDMIAAIGMTAYCVLGIIARHGDANGRCWPSNARIATLCGIKVRAVQKAKATLVEAGLLRSESRSLNGRQRSNGYQIMYPPDKGCTQEHGEGAPRNTGRAHPGTPKQDSGELNPSELEVLDHVFVSKDMWEQKFSEIMAMVPRGAVNEDDGFIGQIAWLLAGGAKIWPQVRDALAGVRMVDPRPSKPIAYIQTILSSTVGHETLLAYLRKSPTREESRTQLPRLRVAM